MMEMDTDLRKWASCIRLVSSANDDQWLELGRLFEASCDRQSVEVQPAGSTDTATVELQSGSCAQPLFDGIMRLVHPRVSLEDALAIIRGEVESRMQKGS